MGLKKSDAFVRKNGILVPYNEFIRRGSGIVQSQFYIRRNILGNYLKLTLDIRQGDSMGFITWVNANVDVDWGDGVKEHLNCRIKDDGTSESHFQHLYSDVGKYTITATSDDWSGGIGLNNKLIDSVEMNLTMKTSATYNHPRGLQIFDLERLKSINFMDSEFEFNHNNDYFHVIRSGSSSGKYSISSIKSAMFNMSHTYNKFMIANNVCDIELPSVMFKNTNYSDWSQVFAVNPNLKTVPSTIFGNANVTAVRGLFSRNTFMISSPKVWEMYPSISADNGGMCYYNCTSLPWYSEIPTGWK